MKKLFAFFAAIILSAACALGVAGCNNGGDKYTVFAPDGAPALSLIGTVESPVKDKFDISVVKADTINAYVTGENPQADFAIMPVNAAVKALGSGEKYKMLGTVTHGNLFLLRNTLKESDDQVISSAADMQKLVGTTVGVINLTNIPGQIFKVILTDNLIPYAELKDGGEVASDKVNLKNVTAQQAIPATDCDYFVVPEPAASTKIAATGGKLSLAGNLQTLYGGSGYPQAVAVAKTTVIEKDREAVEEFIAALSLTDSIFGQKKYSAETIVGYVGNWLVGDTAPTFTAENLSDTVIANCGIKFVNNAGGKAAVLAFMQKLNGITGASWGTPAEAFFY